MNFCNMPIKISENNFIRIYNDSNFLVSLLGSYFIGQEGHFFSSDNCPPNASLEVTFPANATQVDFLALMWVITEGRWVSFANVSKAFPGRYCFRVTGTIVNPLLTEIPCPNRLTCCSRKYSNKLKGCSIKYTSK